MIDSPSYGYNLYTSWGRLNSALNEKTLMGTLDLISNYCYIFVGQTNLPALNQDFGHTDSMATFPQSHCQTLQ
jgi:hypothetical protein